MAYKLTHPNSKHTVETNNPEPYLSQGWVEVVEDPKPTKTTTTPKAD